ncbi:hypothetical protein SAMN05421505_11226 [Sinosporangium album]|uniref:Uncharacterized protein n=1 Tax=Sinosporangium album TaxID=504805 RepID=A0A1G8A5N4_9ACTN|nr:hypothetical protein SAMN05421505_11226 [Sinosporangium album]
MSAESADLVAFLRLVLASLACGGSATRTPGRLRPLAVSALGAPECGSGWFLGRFVAVLVL